MKQLLLLLAIIMAWMCLSAANTRRVYSIAETRIFTDTCVVYGPLGREPYSAIELRLSVNEPRRLQTGSSPAWFEVHCGKLRFIARKYSPVSDNIHDGSTIKINVYSADTLIESADARGVKLNGAQNSYLLEWNDSSDTLHVYTGSERLHHVLSAPVNAPAGSDSLSLIVTGEASVSVLVTEEKDVPRQKRLAGLPSDSLDVLVARNRFNFPDGIYRYLDRAADPSIARPGGRYTLAVATVPGTPGTHAIYYVDGAEVESQFWHTGMLKGFLRATPFKNQYDLEWYDSHGNPIPGGADSYAVTDAIAATLTLTFPSLDGATIRFARTSKP